MLWFGPAAPQLLLEELRRPWRTRPSRVAVSLLPNGRIPTDFLGDRIRGLHGLDWPDRALWICALGLVGGERAVFGYDESPVDVGTAVEASSAIPGFFKPVWIGGKRYVDGAIHSPTNADLLAANAASLDLDLVVISSPMSGACRSAIRSLDGASRLASAAALRREVAAVREAGCEVLVLEPGAEEISTMGPIAMDPTRLVPTILQTSASTLRRMAEPAFAGQLSILTKSAERATPPPEVPFPDRTTRRAS